jgi:hypothetical protein
MNTLLIIILFEFLKLCTLMASCLFETTIGELPITIRISISLFNFDDEATVDAPPVVLGISVGDAEANGDEELLTECG